MADVDALLYLPGHSAGQLQRALRIPALSKGWQGSFEAMLQQDFSPKSTAGNPGLAYEEQAPAWPGFRKMRVANILKESDSVTSFILKPIDAQPFPLFQAGQFVVLRLHLDPDKPPVLRSYSLSDLPADDHLRISVKSELNGIGSSFLCNRTKEGDALDVSAPRGSFTLRPGQNPVVLLSAGVGATPVMSMLHALAAEKSQQEIWWIYGARNSADHPFAEESRSLLKQLARARGYIVYSRPDRNRPSRSRLRYSGPHRHSIAGENWRAAGQRLLSVRPHFIPTEYARWPAKMGRARRECAHGNFRFPRSDYSRNGAGRSHSASAASAARIRPSNFIRA